MTPDYACQAAPSGLRPIQLREAKNSLFNGKVKRNGEEIKRRFHAKAQRRNVKERNDSQIVHFTGDTKKELT